MNWCRYAPCHGLLLFLCQRLLEPKPVGNGGLLFPTLWNSSFVQTALDLPAAVTAQMLSIFLKYTWPIWFPSNKIPSSVTQFWHQGEFRNHICRFLLLCCNKSIDFPKRQKTPDVSTGSFHDANSRVPVFESNTWSRWCSTGKTHEHLGLISSSYMEKHFSSMHIAKTLKSEEKCKSCFQDFSTCHF